MVPARKQSPNPQSQLHIVQKPVVQRIFVPLDGSGYAERALACAVELAHEHHAELIIVNVFNPASAAHSRDVLMPATQTTLEQARTHADTYLTATVNKLRKQNVNARGYCIEGSDISAVSAVIASEGAELVVMTGEQRNWLQRLLLGDPVAVIERETSTPVMLV